MVNKEGVEIVHCVCLSCCFDGEAPEVPMAPAPALRGNSGDPRWKYGKYCDPNNKCKIKCSVMLCLVLCGTMPLPNLLCFV